MCSLCEIQFPVPLGRFYWHAPGVLCMLSLGLWLSLYYSRIHDTCNAQDICCLASSGSPATLSSDYHIVLWSLFISREAALGQVQFT